MERWKSIVKMEKFKFIYSRKRNKQKCVLFNNCTWKWLFVFQFFLRLLFHFSTMPASIWNGLGCSLHGARTVGMERAFVAAVVHDDVLWLSNDQLKNLFKSPKLGFIFGKFCQIKLGKTKQTSLIIVAIDWRLNNPFGKSNATSARALFTSSIHHFVVLSYKCFHFY